ncbi:MAG: HD domain-containing protein [Clostridia bacterium]|nr:HD domain-containing protein [Clostridia bacterium]
MKKLLQMDQVKNLIMIAFIFISFIQYIHTRKMLFVYVFIFLIMAFILLEIVILSSKKTIRHENNSQEKDRKEDEAEVLLLKNQTKLVNHALKNALELNSELKNQMNEKTEELEVLREVSQVISSTFEIQTIVEYIYKLFNRFTKCDRYIICFVNKDENRLTCKYEYGNHIYNKTGELIEEDSSTITSCFNTRQTVVRINVPMKETEQYGDKLALPLTVSGEIEGVIYVESAEPGSFLNINLRFLESISNYFAVALKSAELFNDIFCQKQEIEALYEETAAVNDELNTYIMDLNQTKEELKIKNDELGTLYDEMQTGYLQTVMALANSIEAKDPYTRGHCQRVMEISCEIATQMGMEEKDIEDLRYAAILHDIGKIGISADILNKAGKLTEVEFNEIQKHPQIAFNILKDVKFIQKGLDAILEHHERYDGRGYPYRKLGDEISVFGRILCIADAFDAMTSDRPYRKGMPMEDAIREIERCKGAQFDPQIADIFIKMNEEMLSWASEEKMHDQ